MTEATKGPIMAVFQRLYGATPFDPNDRQDQIGEAARKHMLKVANETGLIFREFTDQDMAYLIGGMIVGVVQILQSTGPRSDATDAAIRASILQITPWAVDMSRSTEGKEPLANA